MDMPINGSSQPVHRRKSRKGKENGNKGEKGKGDLKEREKRKKIKEKEKKQRKRKEAIGFFLSSLAFQRSELVGPKNKVRRFDKGLCFQR